MDFRSAFLSRVVRGRISFRRREGVVRSLPAEEFHVSLWNGRGVGILGGWGSWGGGKGEEVDGPFVIAPALLIRLTGGLSLPSLCHGVLVCSSFAWPIASSIWELNSSSCLSALFWCSSFAWSA